MALGNMMQGLGNAIFPQGTEGLGTALQHASPLMLAMGAGLSQGQPVGAYMPQGIAMMNKMADSRRKREQEEEAKGLFGGLFGGQQGGQTMTPFNPGGQQSSRNAAMAAHGGPTKAAAAAIKDPQSWEAIKAGIFKGESGGDYNALFGYSNRPGGQFENVRLTDMTVDEALNFADPSGPYAQTVKGQVGRVATPMGAYQVVGTTLKAAKEGLGLTGNEQMTPELQDQIGKWIYSTQGTGAWEGYQGPQTGGGAQTAQVADPMQDPQVQRMMQIMAHPGLSDGQRGVVQTMLEQRVSQLQPRERDTQYVDGVGLIDKQTGDVVQSYDTTEELPATVQALQWRAQEAGMQPGTEEYRNFMIQGGRDNGMAIDVDPATGAVSFRQGSGAGTSDKPFTEGQSKDNVYATRAEGALSTLDPIAGELTDRIARGAEMAPMGLARGLQSDDFQVAQNAGDEFLQAILRKDTGAAITEQEQILYGRTYLPQPGDSEAVLAQKQTARRRAVEALKAGMSPSQIVAQGKALLASGSEQLDPVATPQGGDDLSDDDLLKMYGG